MRRGEILSLTWDKVDFAKRMIRLEVTDTKDRQARNVPICTELFEMLRESPNKLHAGDDDNHVFQFHEKRFEISGWHCEKLASWPASFMAGRRRAVSCFTT